MEKKDLRIVFMGTPEFAVESLNALITGGYNVVGVITMPDKPAGRGHKIHQSAVKTYALAHNLPLLQPEKLRGEPFLAQLRAWQADLQIVVAFRMLPEVVWNMPRLGTFNLHASLLPQYRGAAPIQWAIINGEKETGVTTFFLTHEIDTGKIIRQQKTPILPTDNAGTLHDKLMPMGAQLVCQTVDAVLSGAIDATEQAALIAGGEPLKTAPKLFKETCELTENKRVDEAHDFVRGLSPHPAAWATLQFPQLPEPIPVKIFSTTPEKTDHRQPLGSVVVEGRKSVKIALKDGFLHLNTLQTPGKKRMSAADFLNGIK